MEMSRALKMRIDSCQFLEQKDQCEVFQQSRSCHYCHLAQCSYCNSSLGLRSHYMRQNCPESLGNTRSCCLLMRSNHLCSCIEEPNCFRASSRMSSGFQQRPI